jgi:hypothetical protein
MARPGARCRGTTRWPWSPSLRDIRTRHGHDAVAVYQGNPTVHNLGLLTYGQLFLRKLGTKNAYSATSLDQLPHMLAALRTRHHATESSSIEGSQEGREQGESRSFW